MELIIENPNNLNLDAFCSYLISEMIEYIDNTINDNQLIRFDSYINNNLKIRFIDKFPRLLKSRDILITAVQTLYYVKQGNDYIIKINPNNFIPNTYAKFIDIVSLIDKGNIDIPPYPIFTDAMEYFADNLQMYYNLYIEDTSKAKETNGN